MESRTVEQFKAKDGTWHPSQHNASLRNRVILVEGVLQKFAVADSRGMIDGSWDHHQGQVSLLDRLMASPHLFNQLKEAIEKVHKETGL